MTKMELGEKLAAELKIPPYRGLYIVDALLSMIQQELFSGNEVNLRPFGKFQLVKRAELTRRNVHTGELFKVPECKAVKFTMSTKLREKARRLT